jgi:hypothetical protein
MPEVHTPAFPVFSRHDSGLYQPLFPYQSGAANAQIVASGQVMATRCAFVRAIQSVSFIVNSGTASSAIVVATFAEVANANPGALIAQSASVDCSTTGTKTATIAIATGVVWVASERRLGWCQPHLLHQQREPPAARDDGEPVSARLAQHRSLAGHDGSGYVPDPDSSHDEHADLLGARGMTATIFSTSSPTWRVTTFSHEQPDGSTITFCSDGRVLPLRRVLLDRRSVQR